VQSNPDPVNTGRSAVFTVEYRNENIFIVIFMEKTLRPVELDVSLEPYFKGLGVSATPIAPPAPA